MYAIVKCPLPTIGIRLVGFVFVNNCNRGFVCLFSLCKEDAEERRKIVEGADALLNLAGINTRRLRKRSSSVECIDAKRECTDTLRQMYLKKQTTDNNNEPASVIIEHHKDKFR